MAAWVLSQIVHLLHPIMPFCDRRTLAASHRRKRRAANWIEVARGPFYDGEAFGEINWVIGFISEIRTVSVRNECSYSDRDRAYVNPLPHAIPYIENWLDQIKKLARLKDVQLAKSFPLAMQWKILFRLMSATRRFGLILRVAVDLGKERARLKKESEAVRGELDKIAVKLGNPQFIAKAKPEAIDEQREREAQGRAALARLDAALARLGGA